MIRDLTVWKKLLKRWNISLEESFQLYGKGIEMIKQLKEKLDATEKKIIVLEEE